ncbi:diacylglycerol/lipid kinase family protein [Rhodococcus tukisamuensis]|uniref:Diacylglycerol kinase family enzyme n=1 Tax=Rhodococcus tukisamuensis TaxID=168276 RepID=A0A1G6YI30_9NOCA|nr:diacylglycerol kinase family protein [Rhodococcus tukisamuensis]SDD90154.1 Diacylglycerol kinase family enzyme [Rhodococcus tukisamuensis]
MRALLIVNPNATSTTPAARDLLAHALSSRVEVRVVTTTHRGHAAELARRASLEGVRLIIVHGGDGTVNEVINGLLGAPEPDTMSAVTFGPTPLVAVVPGGSANVFARSLGIDADPVVATNQLIELLELRERRRVGLGHCDGRWFTFNAGMGFDAQVCEAIDASRANGHAATPSRYVRTALRAFLRNRRLAPTLTVHTPGHEPVDGVHYAFVSNSSPWTYLNARPVRVNPETAFETGLGVFAMRTTSVTTTLRLIRQMLTPGSQPKSRKLFRTDNVPRVRIVATAPIGLQLDGDYIGMRSEVEFVSVPDALTVIAPSRA